jgi:serine/threonine protein kinase
MESIDRKMKGQELFEGRYQVLEALRTDEIGYTYLVKDRESGDQLALRDLLPSIVADSALRQELETEFKLAKSLRHPNIGALYEFSWLEGKGAFIVMEYIQGERLRDLLFKQPGGRCDKPTFHSWAFQILSAIEHAHQAGVTHRDLTPDNIMITSKGSVKVIDFGIDAIIREMHFKNTGNSPFLSTHYVPSEPLPDPVSHVSPMMDIFSIGCVFYEMLGGNLPFYRGDTILGRRDERTNPISGVSQHLKNLILRCMNNDKRRRPQSVTEIQTAVQLSSVTRQEEEPIVEEQKKEVTLVEEVPPTLVQKEAYGIRVALASVCMVIILAAFWWYQVNELPTGLQVAKQEESTAGETNQKEPNEADGDLPVVTAKSQESTVPDRRTTDFQITPSQLSKGKPARAQPTDLPDLLLLDRYTIQVGAFRIEESARRVLSQLSEKDYLGRIEQPEAGEDRDYYVWIGQFTSRTQASRLQSELKADGFETYIKNMAAQ